MGKISEISVNNIMNNAKSKGIIIPGFNILHIDHVPVIDEDILIKEFEKIINTGYHKRKCETGQLFT